MPDTDEGKKIMSMSYNQLKELFWDLFRNAKCKAGHMIPFRSVRFSLMDKLNPVEQDTLNHVIEDIFNEGLIKETPGDGGLQGFQLLLQAGTLLHQDILAGCLSAFLEEQGNVLDKGFHLHSGTTHALDEFHPAAGCLVKFTDAVCFAGDVGDKANPFVIADGVGGYIVFLTYFFDGHNLTSL